MNILVVDDEALARERLLRLLARLRPGALCTQADSGEAALAEVARQLPDLVLLDIRMPGLDGIEVAAHLDALVQPPAIIFCTAYDEYALAALRHQTVAYLLKPVREEELSRALDNAGRINRIQLSSLRQDGMAGQGRSQVSSHTHRGLETMEVTEIRCFLAEQKYVTACDGERELLIPDTLKELENEFGDRFLRVHRNALVAVQHVERLQRDHGGSWQVLLKGIAHKPAVSRRHLASVKERIATR